MAVSSLPTDVTDHLLRPNLFFSVTIERQKMAREALQLHDTSSKNIERAEKGEADTERWVTEAVTL